MAHVTLVGNLRNFADGESEMTIAADSVRKLITELVRRHPALAPHLDEGVAIAIDGQIYQDALLEPIGPASEVHVLPKIAGG